VSRAAASILLAVLTLPLAAHASVVVSDDDGRRLTLPHSATRIVSVAPGATEMLFAAGAGRYVIATVEYSDEPPEALRVPRIGDGIAVDMERVVALRPDVVVVWPGGGNPAQIAKLQSLGFPLYHQQVNTLADLPASLRRLGQLAGTQTEAERAALDIESRLAALERKYTADKSPPTVLLQVWNRPIYTVGGKHLISDALRLCGARNVFGDLDDMGPAVDVEAVFARDPDLIIAVAPQGTANEWLNDWRRFKNLLAVRSGHLIAFEDKRLPRLGPSALSATEGLCKAIDATRAAR
jgi:iron complex transport system substrate-binding protein